VLNFGRFVFVVLFVGLLLVVPNSVCAKSDPLTLKWSKTYDDYGASSVIQSHDGGFVIAGSNITRYTNRFTTYSHTPLLMEVNGAGRVKWKKMYSETVGSVSQLTQTPDSGYLAAIATYTGDFESGFLLKTDSQGRFESSRTLDNLNCTSGFTLTEEGKWVRVGYIYACSVAEDGSYVIGGHLLDAQALVVKYGAEGNLLWQKVFDGGNDYVYVRTILQSSSGDGYFVAGSWGKSGWFAKLDLEGEVVWSHMYVYRDKYGIALDFDVIVPTLDGGFVLGGYDYEFGWVVRVDGDGNELWHKQCGGEDGLEVLMNAYYVSGVVELGSGQFLVFNLLGIRCLDAFGEELWFEPYSMYLKCLEDIPPTAFVHLHVTGVIGDDGHLVVAISYLNAEVAVRGHSGYSLWVAGFVLESVSMFDSFVLLFVGVVVVAVVVVVFIGCLVYLKRGVFRR